MRSLVAEGTDPREQQKLKAREALDNTVTFKTLAQEWLRAREPSVTPRYLRLIEMGLAKDIFPILGDMPVRSILPRTILDALRLIEARGSFEMARRVKNHCREIFRFGITDGRCLSDPCRDVTAAMIKPPPKKHRATVEIKALPDFYRRLNIDDGERMSHLALRWTILTMVRTQETRVAQRSEFEGLDGDTPLWRISPERMKMRSEHLVPLPPQAIELLREIKQINVFGNAGNERYGKYLFPVVCSRTDP